MTSEVYSTLSVCLSVSVCLFINFLFRGKALMLSISYLERKGFKFYREGKGFHVYWGVFLSVKSIVNSIHWEGKG